MKVAAIAAATTFGLSCWKVCAEASSASPVGTLVKMIEDYAADFRQGGEQTQHDFEEFSEWCEERSRELSFEIKTGKSEVESLTASIAEEGARMQSLGARVEKLGGDLAGGASKLKKAVAVREKEAADFAAEEKELMETVDMLRRATGILEHEAQGGAAMLQLKNVQSITEALSVMLGASVIDASDAATLTAFVQSAQKGREQEEAGEEEEEAPGAPAAAAYQSQSGSIIDTLQDLTEKAEGQLASLRQSETASAHNFELLKQSLEDENRFAAEDMGKAKKGMAASAERKAAAEGELKVISKELAEDEKARNKLRHACIEKAEQFKVEMTDIHKTLKVLASVKSVVADMQRDDSEAPAFLQAHRSRLSSRRAASGRGRSEAVRVIRNLAFKEHSSALVQLASRMEAVLSSSSDVSDDAFGKVKELIASMINKLEEEADSDATHKAYCDREMSETKEKIGDKTEDAEVATTRIEQARAKSTKLKEEVALLENELSKLAKSQARLDKLRQEQSDHYTKNKAWAEKALEAGHTVVKMLTEHFGSQEENQGRPSGQIISFVEGLVADGNEYLANLESEEQSDANEYKQLSGENEIEKVTKEQDVKYKTKESKELDKTSAELAADLRSTQEELAALSEYLAKLGHQCIQQPMSYEERTQRRAAEVAGLKSALEILSSETSLLQRHSQRQAHSGTLQHLGQM